MRHHDEYFVKGGDFYLKCDDILFRVHSFFLHRDSAVFRKMIDTPACSSKPSCGKSESTPFEIKCATVEEFAKFCWVIYNKTYSIYDATPKQWLSILKIARKYEFDEATNCAIRGLLDGETCTMDLIKHFQELNVPHHHLIPLYAHLCRLENGPDEDDVKIIGTKVALNIFRVRECLLKALSDSNPAPVLKHVDEDDIVEAICLVFGFKKPTCKRGTVTFC
ncbi:hypothetical protein BJ165DRAFT_1344170 [Panaeolus papilionaceus]|nr:hypothetical protein BJ165DRAFT_1344170 [Panaeolus papilionaceus]